MNPQSGIDHLERGAKWGLENQVAYQRENYHQPSDEFNPDWNLEGAVEDLKLLFEVGVRLSRESSFPNWKPKSEYRAKRDEMMQGN